jgi:hypothetical protein
MTRTDTPKHAPHEAGEPPVPPTEDVAAIHTLLDETRKLIHERDALRTALIAVGRSVGGFLSDEVTTKFITENVPNEVELVLRSRTTSAFARGYKRGVEEAANMCENASRLADTVMETNCYAEAQLFRIRAQEIRTLLDKVPATT